MSTQAQIEANRLNALKSTGPKTDEGKARSSHNALTHGLTATGQSLLPCESADSYHQFVNEVIQSLRPSTPLENVLARRVADTLWRLQRLPEAEAQLFLAIPQKARARIQEENEDEQERYKNQLRWSDRDKVKPPELQPLPEDPTPAQALAKAFMKKDSQNPFMRLQRYEQALNRTLNRSLDQLRQLQRDRQKNPAAQQPIAPAIQDDPKTRPGTPRPSPQPPVQNEASSAITQAPPASCKPTPDETPRVSNFPSPRPARSFGAKPEFEVATPY